MSKVIESIKEKIIAEKIIPARTALFSDFPEKMNEELKDFLKNERGIQQLYSHQAEMFNKVLENENVVITTSTASGKTLSFLLPVIHEILRNPKARAIFLYPTKALASDQYRNMKPFLDYFGRNRIQAGVYDGDTPIDERLRIQSSANIILTNPDMLNSSILPNHNESGFKFIFSNLKFIVLDELHTYRGAFGSHIGNLMSRVNRICKYYYAKPQYLCSSATIANPVELAENVCSGSFSLVEKDGSPAPEKRYYIVQPPLIPGNGFKKTAEQEASEFLPKLVINNESFIAFCKSRRAVEVVLKESKDALKDYLGDYSGLIAGYRGGYKPEERKEIENNMVKGTLKGLISTNALEVGIDIGKIDNTVIVGYPGTRASFWQQSGRAGRSGKAASTFLILANLPFDQYIAIDNEWLFSTGSENAVIDKSNLNIQLSHVRAAAAELPLTLDDIEIFNDLGQIIPVLMELGELESINGQFIWSGKSRPTNDFSLRNTIKETFKLRNSIDGKILTEMDEMQAFREVYKGAIYLHRGEIFQVEEMDLKNRISSASPINVNYYTVPFSSQTVKVIKDFQNKSFARTHIYFGDVKVTDSITSYKRVQFHNNQNLGFENLDEPLVKEMITEGARISVPKNVNQLFTYLNETLTVNRGSQWKTYFDALAYSLLNAAQMVTMSGKSDINAACLVENVSDSIEIAVCIYDLYEGGLGFAEKVYEVYEQVVEQAITMLKGCQCKSGCPVCIGDYNLLKEYVIWGLENIFEEYKIPQNINIENLRAPQVVIDKKFTFDDLESNWETVREFLKGTGEYLTSFLSHVQDINVCNKKLILNIDNQLYKEWLLEEYNYKNLVNTISNYVDVPNDFKIQVDVIEDLSNTVALNEKILAKMGKYKK